MTPIVTLHLPMPFDLFNEIIAAVAARYPDAHLRSTDVEVTLEVPA